MSKSFLRTAKNVVNGYSSAQILVRNATSNDPTGPSLDIMDEISERSYDTVDFYDVMDMLDKRLNDKGKNWRHVAKSLTVLDYLVRYGSENCVLWCQENIYIIKTLREFTAMGEDGNDHGQIIRVKAKELTALLKDDERLKEERNMRSKKKKGRRRDQRNKLPGDSEYDEDFHKALEESKVTAEEEERKRWLSKQDQLDDDADLQTALQLSKEEEELRKLKELQSQQMMMQGWKEQGQQVYCDIFGNPISADEYLQHQQQQMLAQLQYEQMAQQQALVENQLSQQHYQQMAQQQLAQQQTFSEQQKNFSEHQFIQQQPFSAQQYLAPQEYLTEEQISKQQQSATGIGTNFNNPFSLSRNQEHNQVQSQPLQTFKDDVYGSSQQVSTNNTSVPTGIQKTRTGNASISEKYGELNSLLAQGPGIDTFGNTGETRIPAIHTKTGTFINSQGTGYKQCTNQPKNNPFLTTQYTGLPSSGIVPFYTGYGFGNQSSTPVNPAHSNIDNRELNLIDL